MMGEGVREDCCTYCFIISFGVDWVQGVFWAGLKVFFFFFFDIAVYGLESWD